MERIPGGGSPSSFLGMLYSTPKQLLVCLCLCLLGVLRRELCLVLNLACFVLRVVVLLRAVASCMKGCMLPKVDILFKEH